MIFASYDQKQVEILTREAGSEATAAMKLLIQNVLGTKADAVDPMIPIETTRDDLGQLLFYSLVSGYFLREAEVRMYMQEQLMEGGELHIPALSMDVKTGENSDSKNGGSLPQA
mmetsp:Transcript_37217/g.148538  ORF Transcript_37217/g.148538 Transcript_37217/m.148538 type:complete len:114 (-) Transcript_37217:711-1052(-)